MKRQKTGILSSDEHKQPKRSQKKSTCTRVCLCTCSSPLLSASTLNESELQYSVGGAGIEYPAGGPSTHAQPFMYV